MIYLLITDISLDEWKKVYSKEAAIYKRNDDDLCKEAVYGLPEINKEAISKGKINCMSRMLSNICSYSISSLSSQGIIENEGIVIDSKSGTSGGGREPNQKLLLSECGEGLSAYGLINHRHTSEIEQVAS